MTWYKVTVQEWNENGDDPIDQTLHVEADTWADALKSGVAYADTQIELDKRTSGVQVSVNFKNDEDYLPATKTAKKNK